MLFGIGFKNFFTFDSGQAFVFVCFKTWMPGIGGEKADSLRDGFISFFQTAVVF